MSEGLPSKSPKSGWTTLVLWIGALLLGGLLLCIPQAASAQAIASSSSPVSTTELCTATTIPTEECRALVNFYQATDGAHWITHTHWLTIDAVISPCDWFGVVCDNGHVTQLVLSHNGLRSTTSGDSALHNLSRLSQLTTLLLANNQLNGNVAPRICDLTKTVQQADFAFNQLAANHLLVARCLNQLDPDWATTQTVPPAGLQVTAITTDSLELQWTPIGYSQGAGYYEINCWPCRNGRSARPARSSPG